MISVDNFSEKVGRGKRIRTSGPCLRHARAVAPACLELTSWVPWLRRGATPRCCRLCRRFAAGAALQV